MGLKGPPDLQRENPAWIVFPDDVEQTLAADLPEPSVQNFLQDASARSAGQRLPTSRSRYVLPEMNGLECRNTVQRIRSRGGVQESDNGQ